MKKLRITVEGKTYEVDVEIVDEGFAYTPAPAAVRPAAVAPVVAAPVAAAPAPVAAAPAGAKDVASPLSAVVVSVDCNIGDEVKAGQKLLTLEAMKMNTFVNAPADGKVAAILVKAGDSVQEGQALISMA